MVSICVDVAIEPRNDWIATPKASPMIISDEEIKENVLDEEGDTGSIPYTPNSRFKPMRVPLSMVQAS